MKTGVEGRNLLWSRRREPLELESSHWPYEGQRGTELAGTNEEVTPRDGVSVERRGVAIVCQWTLQSGMNQLVVEQ